MQGLILGFTCCTGGFRRTVLRRPFDRRRWYSLQPTSGFPLSPQMIFAIHDLHYTLAAYQMVAAKLRATVAQTGEVNGVGYSIRTGDCTPPTLDNANTLRTIIAIYFIPLRVVRCVAGFHNVSPRFLMIQLIFSHVIPPVPIIQTFVHSVAGRTWCTARMRPTTFTAT